ncbi:MAG: RNA-directed DNA polymerase [Aureispira sp.]
MNEISNDVLFDGLLGHGLFAKKIPNFLSSELFLHYFKEAYIKPEKLLDISPSPKGYIRYNNMRNNSTPRPLAIPEPFAYALLSYTLKENWQKLQIHFNTMTLNNSHKISRIHVRNKKAQKAIFEMNYKNFDLDGNPVDDIIIGKRYQVNADISKCFPSIYSHATSWALEGKSNAKNNINKKEEWYNKIDFSTRNIKYGETNGLLIGPHASNLLSEIILTRVDKELSDQKFQYIRNIDDYTCYVSSYGEAEKFLLTLSKELSKYELSLNHKKSEIKKLPTESEASWANQLRRYINHEISYFFTKKIIEKKHISIKKINTIEIKMFLDFVVSLTKKNNQNVSIINYAIKTLSNKELSHNAQIYLLKKIHHLVLLYPYLCSILEKHLFDAHKVDPSYIIPIAKDLYKEGINNNNYEACSYSIYWSLKYGIQFDNGYIDPSKNNNTSAFSYYFKEDAIKSEDCIFLLLAFLYDKRHKIPDRPSYQKEYRQCANHLKKNDFDKYWLFIYEVLSADSLPFLYKKMKNEKISFVEEQFNTTPHAHNKPHAMPTIPPSNADET